MEEKILTCTVCPIGCQITVRGNEDGVESVEGYECKRGLTYATAEFIRPERILTTSVKAVNCDLPLISVRTDKPIPKDLMFECMQELKELVVPAPVECGQILIKNIAGTDANLIATCEIKCSKE